MDLYRANILDHCKNPRNYGILDKPDKSAESYNATCGDRIRFDIRLHHKLGIIKEVRFSGTGCAISMAAASMLSEEVIGRNLKEVIKIKAGHMRALIGSTLTPSRIKCATLPLEVLQKALVE